jgi:hypothetical protein
VLTDSQTAAAHYAALRVLAPVPEAVVPAAPDSVELPPITGLPLPPG